MFILKDEINDTLEIATQANLINEMVDKMTELLG